MTNEIYILPITSSWMDSPKFCQKTDGDYELICEFEDIEVAEIIQFNLTFKKCLAAKCTYSVATDVDVSHSAYDKVVDFGETEWLRKIKKNLAISEWETGQLRHFGIFFDDGPLYEFICESFSHDESIKVDGSTA